MLVDRLVCFRTVCGYLVQQPTFAERHHKCNPKQLSLRWHSAIASPTPPVERQRAGLPRTLLRQVTGLVPGDGVKLSLAKRVVDPAEMRHDGAHQRIMDHFVRSLSRSRKTSPSTAPTAFPTNALSQRLAACLCSASCACVRARACVCERAVACTLLLCCGEGRHRNTRR